MKLSVVVPTYNLGTYVKALLQDLEAQTAIFELWLIDDGSTDNTFKQLEEFVQGHSEFHVVQLPHRGVSVARNYGLLHSTGDAITFIDGDDMIADKFVETMVDGLQRGAVMAAVGYEWYRRPRTQSNEFIEVDQQTMFDQVSQHGSEIGGYVWNKAFNRQEIINADLKFDESLHLAEDYLFTASFVAHTPGKYVYLPRVLYTKRNRPDSTIHMATSRDRLEEDGVFEQIRAMEKMIK
ncbi:glycosyltransferase family 2 protein [Paucilactobacillus kaifaensis]|uniref:glycosyltransferase family 2 protein n=1 Tax=Paucilactobacillus kaifaensis TaxID=2559921 RepID=UPI0010F6A52B|nr:glycosyltransferase family A protein [Paucilactobacillus kaifaensis]